MQGAKKQQRPESAIEPIQVQTTDEITSQEPVHPDSEVLQPPPEEPLEEESHPAQLELRNIPLRSIFPVLDYNGNPLPIPAQLMPGPGE